MINISLYLRETMEGDEACALSRSHELQWCRRATEMELSEAALQCINRNTREELLESEPLAWFCVKARAVRSAVRDKDGNMSEEGRHRLRKQLDSAESHGPGYFDASPRSDVIEFNLLTLLIRTDLELLTDDKVDGVLSAVENAMARDTTERDARERDTIEREKDNLREICEIAILYYDDTWDDRDAVSSATAACRVVSLCRPEAAALCRLARHCRGDDQATQMLTNMLAPLMDSLPAYCLDWSRSQRLPIIAPLQDDKLIKLRRCLQLLCGAERTLLHHCTELAAIKDAASWSRAFTKMKMEVFENELAGADYHALHQHKQALYDIQQYVDGSEAAAVRGSTLRHIASALHARPRARLSVRALCPSLSDAGRDVTDALGALLGIHGVEGIEDEISVFTDTVSRPGVVTVRTRADPRRFFIKRERLARDRAATAVAAVIAPEHKLPEVILLSDECGLMEYLEDHQRIRDLIAERVDLNATKKRQAMRNDELVLAPPAVAEKNYATICGTIPTDALRRAIESRSSSVEDFISKLQRFQDELVSMTLVTWLLGLGDRHLNNIMYWTVEGGVKGVDWGALNQYGTAELPPARLTPQLLAVCTDGLEASLQHAVTKLRERRRGILPVLELAFQAANCQEQLSTVEDLLYGRALPSDVTRRRIAASDMPHKQLYIKLLDDLCPNVADKETYSVDEQVSSLLLQSTSPRVLAVTRTEWEPWL